MSEPTEYERKGGSAFPWMEPFESPQGDPGMTLRDYFAAQSMSARRNAGGAYGTAHDQMARLAYQDADAMLAERSK